MAVSPMENLDLSKYLQIALRRRYWIIIPFLTTLLGGLTYALVTPEVYEAKTLILVQPQKVPTEFIRSIVTIGVEERLKTISEQVTSRTNLEAIVAEYKLYHDHDMLIDDKVELLRKRIKINVGRGGGAASGAFEISYRGEEPRKVMQVTNALASNFISENLKIRESQALGTSDFLSDELEAIKRRLTEREAQVTDFRQEHMGSLPDQLQTNLSVLTRLQTQLEQLNSNLRDAENRKLIIQQQAGDLGKAQRQRAGVPASVSQAGTEQPAGPATGEAQEIGTLKRQLAALEGRYTPNHPDVKRLRKTIAKLESEEAGAKAQLQEQEQERGESKEGTESRESVAPAAEDLSKLQLQQIEVEIWDLKSDISKIQSRIDDYQDRVDDAPKREQEMRSLARDYENLKQLYTSMLNRKLEADIAVSMEKKQKGEQFRVLDPGKMPARPVEPDARKILLITLVLGLGLGGGLAYLIEFLDMSYKSPEDIERDLQVPVLVSMPFRHSEQDLKWQVRRQMIIAACIAAGFLVSAFGIVLATKGLSATLGFAGRSVSSFFGR